MLIPDSKPWLLFPDLAEDRLSVLAALFVAVRREVKDAHEEEKGDGPWSAGTRAYERYMHAIRLASEQYEWLKVIEDNGLAFAFTIGNVPLRFYTGSAEEPHVRTRRRREAETKKLKC